jgi:hypothetical protein
MNITKEKSQHIIRTAEKYLEKPFDYWVYNCVHFIIDVYENNGIILPNIERYGYPPIGYHVIGEQFNSMPIGQSVFFKRKANTSNRIWTHVAIIYSNNELIHCSRHFGNKVVTTPKDQFLDIYALAPTAP